MSTTTLLESSPFLTRGSKQLLPTTRPYIPRLESREETKISSWTQTTLLQFMTKEQRQEIRLSPLFDFYKRKIVPKMQYYFKGSDKKKINEALEKKTCNKDCNRTKWSYQDSVIFRHAHEPQAHKFARQLIDLDYRYCKDCHRLMPKPERRKGQALKGPSICPCCNKRMAYISVLIRKTKMKEALFKFQGY